LNNPSTREKNEVKIELLWAEKKERREKKTSKKYFAEA